jgi:thiol-disulfide isomerase/thioredoxin
MFARFGAAALLFAPSALAGQTGQAAVPELRTGKPAPALSVERWIKGTPVAGLETGKVYVVEFWATWCGPCIASMPHLSALQREYGDKVTFVGTNIWEDYDDATLAKVEGFVERQGDRMAYRVAYDGPAKAMDAAWMQAAGRKGIPSAFIVDPRGTIAWIGHPAQIDYALSEVVAGTWDLAGGPEREKRVLGELAAIGRKLKDDPAGAQADFDAFAAAHPAIARHQDELELDLMRANGRWDEVYRVLAGRVDDAIARKDAMSLNQTAWEIVDPEAAIERRDLALALRAALKADELTDHANPAILDTVARCYAWKGDLAKAVELQSRAVELAGEERAGSLKSTLEEYRAKAGAM